MLLTGLGPDVDHVGAASPHGECQVMRRRSLTWVWWALLLLAPNAGAQAAPAVISRGTDAGGYSAFPDICRAEEGEGSSIRGNRLRVTPKGVEVVPGGQARPPGRN